MHLRQIGYENLSRYARPKMRRIAGSGYSTSRSFRTGATNRQWHPKTWLSQSSRSKLMFGLAARGPDVRLDCTPRSPWTRNTVQSRSNSSSALKQNGEEEAFQVPGMRIGVLPVTFARGGTSNGLLFLRKDLPVDTKDWQPILSAAMGSPDPYGRQLNGMGSGISSTSKVCVIGESSHPDADVDYTFVQVGIKDGSIELGGNCGNMSSVVAPFALNEGLLAHLLSRRHNGDNTVTARIFNTNTNKIIEATFSADQHGRYDPFGPYSIASVPGTGSTITLAFLNPGGAATGKALPTGNAVDEIKLEDGITIPASLVDCSNPGIFVRASDVGVPGDIAPADLDAQLDVKKRLEAIRQEGARMMGLDPSVQSVPKVVMVSKPTSESKSKGVNIVCRALSMQQAHKAIMLTYALCVGAACRMKGTIPFENAVNVDTSDVITVEHPTGTVEVGSEVDSEGNVVKATLQRTARIMMKGEVYYPVQH